MIVATATLLTLSQARATIIGFYTDGVIQEGDVYSDVYIYNYATVDMTGGIVTVQLTTYDYSTLNASDGVLEAIAADGFSTVNLSGVVEINVMSIGESGSVNMFGGNVGSMKAWNHSTVNLYSGTISDYLLAYGSEDLVISIYGYGFEYDPLAGNHQGGQLTGFWLDDTPFSIDLYYDDTPGGPVIDTWSHIVLIPEPTTILLLTVGGIMLRKRD